MKRLCPNCHAELDGFAIRCRCGFEFPEARDVRSDPDQPGCGICGAPLQLMDERCPGCGASGFPALRARRSKKSLGAPPDPE